MYTSILGNLALISLPWLHYLDIRKTIFILILFWVILFFLPKIRLYGKTIGIGILALSAVIFLASIFIIPLEVRQTVELQRRTLDQSGLKVPKQIFVNKLVESYRYREGLLFENLDFGNYFFIGHPRERGGVTEVLKIWLAFLPLLVAGLIKVKLSVRWFTLSLGLLAIVIPVVLTDHSPEAGFLVIVPVAYLVAEGVIYLLNRRKREEILLGIISLLFLFELVTFYAKI